MSSSEVRRVNDRIRMTSTAQQFTGIELFKSSLSYLMRLL